MVVAGEASESEEEEVDTSVSENGSPKLTPLKGVHPFNIIFVIDNLWTLLFWYYFVYLLTIDSRLCVTHTDIVTMTFMSRFLYFHFVAENDNLILISNERKTDG